MIEAECLMRLGEFQYAGSRMFRPRYCRWIIRVQRDVLPAAVEQTDSDRNMEWQLSRLSRRCGARLSQSNVKSLVRLTARPLSVPIMSAENS
jgi:hypothetical protein